MTAVDWFPASPRFQLSYHILSHAMKERIRLRAMIDEPDPTIDSITSVWAGANYYEREVFDLSGVRRLWSTAARLMGRNVQLNQQVSSDRCSRRASEDATL